MKRLSLIFLFATIFCLASTSTFAQTISYLDADYKPATAANYTYKRAIKFKELIHYSYINNSDASNPHWNSRPSGLHRCSLIDYYKTGETALVLNIIAQDGITPTDSLWCSNGFPDGEAIHYYKNGNFKRKEFYKSGKLQGAVIHYNENGTERKREEYVDGKLIEEGKFSVSADSPLIGTWKYIEYYGGYDFGGLKKDPIVLKTIINIFSQNGICDYTIITMDGLSTNRGKSNWKYISTNDSSGVQESYVGNDLEEKANIKWINKNQFEYTVTFNRNNSNDVGTKLGFTRQPSAETKPANTNLPRGEIQKIWVDQDVFEDKQKGMRIHSAFEVSNVKGKKCKITASLEGATSSDEVEHPWGFVILIKDFTPVYENSTYKDFQIFMPYHKLSLVAGENNLSFFVSLHCEGISPYSFPYSFKSVKHKFKYVR